MLNEKDIDQMIAGNITYILDYTKVKRKKLVKITGLSHGAISTMANHGRPQRLPVIEKLLWGVRQLTGIPFYLSHVLDPNLPQNGPSNRYVYLYINPRWPRLLVQMLMEDHFIERHELNQQQVIKLTEYLNSDAVDYSLIDEAVLLKFLGIKREEKS